MLRLIYLVGPPGSGKSTLMSALTRDCLRVTRTDLRLPRDELYRNEQRVGVELGRQRGDFSGTDALAMNIHPVACQWIAHADEPVVLGEGQRLGTRAFLRAAADAGRLVDLVWLDPPAEVCQARRAARGSRQNPQWVKAATTRASRLAEAADAMPGVQMIHVPAHGSARDVAEHVRMTLDLREGLTA